MIEIDGSFGEGGGQIVRTSLTLSLATGKPFRIFNIRAARKRGGLLKQHLTAVRAAAELSRAEIQGAELHSRELTFTPNEVQPGDYRFSVGTAGSATLVLQTVLPVLLTVDKPSTLTLEGGTHNPLAPPFEFLQKTFIPLIGRMGPVVSAQLDRPRYYPHGGGQFHVTVHPSSQLARLELLERGQIRGMRASAIVSQLPRHIAERELKVLARKLPSKPTRLKVVEETRSPGPGNVVLIEIETDQVTEVIAAFGAQGIPAEKVATQAAKEAADYLAAKVPVGRHLANQLLGPLALGSGGSYRTMSPTEHTTTNATVIQKFLNVQIDSTPETQSTWRIDVGKS